jgi:hypothetical protein
MIKHVQKNIISQVDKGMDLTRKQIIYQYKQMMDDSDLNIQGLNSQHNQRLDKVKNIYKIKIIKQELKENI